MERPLLLPKEGCEPEIVISSRTACGCAQLVGTDEDAELRAVLRRGRTHLHEDVRRMHAQVYGRWVQPGSRRYPIRVFSRADWQRLFRNALVRGFFMGGEDDPIGLGEPIGVLVPENATPAIVFHEVVHSYTSRAFFRLTGFDETERAEASANLREAITEFLTRRAGFPPQGLAYDRNVERLQAFPSVTSPSVEQALYRGELMTLMTGLMRDVGVRTAPQLFAAF